MSSLTVGKFSQASKVDGVGRLNVVFVIVLTVRATAGELTNKQEKAAKSFVRLLNLEVKYGGNDKTLLHHNRYNLGNKVI